jgi:hypothetical protein
MAHHSASGIAMSSVVLKPVAEAGHWRVKIAWPNKTPHYFASAKRVTVRWIDAAPTPIATLQKKDHCGRHSDLLVDHKGKPQADHTALSNAAMLCRVE